MTTGNFKWHLVKESDKGVLNEQNIHWKDRDKTEMELYRGVKRVKKGNKSCYFVYNSNVNIEETKS